MILASSDEAKLVFDKWSTEQIEVVCLGGKYTIRGQLSRIDDGRFLLSSAETDARLEISTDAEGLVFGYAEAIELPGVPPNVFGLVIADGGSTGRRLIFITLPKE